MGETAGVFYFLAAEAFFETGEAFPGGYGKAGIVNAFEVVEGTASVFAGEDGLPGEEGWGVELVAGGGAGSIHIIGNVTGVDSEEAGEKLMVLVSKKENCTLAKGVEEIDELLGVSEKK